MIREIVFDTETTGFDPNTGDRVIELGCVELIDHIPTGESFHAYLNPERDVPMESQKVHGLTGEFLADKPLFSAIVDDFLAFIADSPLVIHNALAGRALPIYGDGRNVRDWLYVGDHCTGIQRVLEAGRSGETYNIGGWNEMANIDVVHAVCDILDRACPKAAGGSYRTQVTFVKDRTGHDQRYAIDATKIERELGWRPQQTFASGIETTVRWYLDHQDWVDSVTNGSYRDWVATQYA